MAKLTDREVLSIVDDEFRSAMGTEGGEISKERADAWKYYLSKKLGNEVEGESQVVTSDVSDVIDGVMPSLLRLFTTAENLATFDPVGPEDRQLAAQESDIVSHVFFKENPSFLIMYNWFFDALVQKNGITKAYWDATEEVTSESYENLTDEELAILLDDPELEPVERLEKEIDGFTYHDIQFRRVTKSGRVVVDNVPPEEYRISSDARSLDPSEARMVGHERDVTRDELIAMGFDPKVVDELPAEGDWQEGEEESQRHDRSDDDFRSTRDRSQDLIELRECYIKIDYDGDGRAELRQIMTAGNEVLLNETADRQPFHVISPQPLPHKHFGRGLADKTMDVQEVTTTLTRQVLNNLYHTNNPGHAIWEQGMGENTLDDLLTRRVGGYTRFSRPVNESYAPMTVPFTAAATFPMLEWFDKIKRDRTGIAADSEGLSPDALKNIQSTVMAQANDLSRMKIEAIARIFAETGIKSLFRHIHELLIKHQDKQKIVEIRGQFVPINPKEWRTRTNMTVNIGLGIGSRETNLLHLNAIWEKQAQMAQNGGMNLTVTPRNIYNTAAEIVKNANLKLPEMFFTDPGDQAAPPPPDEQRQLEMMQAQIQQRQQQLDAEKSQLNQAKLQLDAERAQLQHERELAELERKIEADQDRYDIEMEKVSNELTKLELESGKDVPGSRV